MKTVDHEVLAQLRTFLGNEVDDLLREFLTTTPERLQQFAVALGQNDPLKAAQIVHALKSSSGNLGLMVFSALCRDIEEQLRRGEVAGAVQWPNSLQQALFEADASLQTL